MDTTPESKSPLPGEDEKKPLITMPLVLAILGAALIVLLIVFGGQR